MSRTMAKTCIPRTPQSSSPGVVTVAHFGRLEGRHEAGVWNGTGAVGKMKRAHCDQSGRSLGRACETQHSAQDANVWVFCNHQFGPASRPTARSMTSLLPRSRHGLSMPELVAPAQRRPALTASARAVPLDAQVGTKKRSRSNKETGEETLRGPM